MFYKTMLDVLRRCFTRLDRPYAVPSPNFALRGMLVPVLRTSVDLRRCNVSNIGFYQLKLDVKHRKELFC